MVEWGEGPFGGFMVHEISDCCLLFLVIVASLVKCYFLGAEVLDVPFLYFGTLLRL